MLSEEVGWCREANAQEAAVWLTSWQIEQTVPLWAAIWGRREKCGNLKEHVQCSLLAENLVIGEHEHTFSTSFWGNSSEPVNRHTLKLDGFKLRGDSNVAGLGGKLHTGSVI